MGEKGGVVMFVKDFYNDQYKWSLLKSVGFFLIGVGIANECVGMELMPAVPQ